MGTEYIYITEEGERERERDTVCVCVCELEFPHIWSAHHIICCHPMCGQTGCTATRTHALIQYTHNTHIIVIIITQPHVIYRHSCTYRLSIVHMCWIERTTMIYICIIRVRHHIPCNSRCVVYGVCVREEGGRVWHEILSLPCRYCQYSSPWW